ncbi:g- beta wd-40 repeats containing [Fusarium longipes]|uniref:G-beta wd-40 repeats containing n=1 Tax=Fusarium longipes TaxID=694270 RepID=A0A395SHX2_9HYPO|nr:g- beta wd-40 repeats containing [Fusarium longipes]
MFEPEDYTVGWICALPLEMAAARGMLDDVHPGLTHKDPDDSNSYILGEVHGHNIVIACLPAGVYGTTPAATVANNLLRTFKSIRFGLLVGIGGGAPSTEHDIRLGDVVISEPYKTLGGIVQHDRGKILPQGGFERTGSHTAPPTLLLSALSCLKATHMSTDSRVPEFLAQLVDKSPKRMKSKFKHQGASNDRLYQADYDHVDPENPRCDSCDATKIVCRADRDDDDPFFHYGIIASGNQLIKDGRTRQSLSRQYGALCFEMEAAGLYNFPCLVIRGICDYADSHKNKIWQEYAAATAAAFTKELLLYVAPEQVIKERKLITELISTVKQSHETAKKHLAEQKSVKAMLKSQPLDLCIVHNARYDSEDVRSSPKCESGTRIRILGIIEQWANHDLNQPLLWLVSPAGVGKSTIARSAIDILETDKHSVAGYFFKRGEQDRNDTNRIFSTIATQIADNILPFRECLRKSLEGLGKDALEKFNLEKQFKKLLWQPLGALQLEKRSHLRLVIVIDALDECERPEHLQRILQLLSKLCTISIVHTRVLITSRPAPDIIEAFEPHTKTKTVQILQLHREYSEETKKDIRKFLETRFQDIGCKRSVQKQPWPTAEQLDRLVQLSITPEPLFIYAATLCRFVSDKQRGPIRQLNIWLEQGGESQLQQIYTPILDQAFSDFDQQEFHQKLQFLASIVLLARPLSAKCIARILKMDLDDISWWIPRLYAVLHVPPGLERPIELLHKSFSDFLITDSETNKYRIDTAEMHFQLAEKCIQLMKIELKQDICNLQEPGTARKSVDDDRLNRFIPTDLQYACVYWFYHLECSGRPLNNFIYDFLYDHLLHWIEVLTLLGQLAEGVTVLGSLLEASKVRYLYLHYFLSLLFQSVDAMDQAIVHFLKDSNRVMSFFGSIIDRHPLQIYGSLLFFCPVARKVRQLFWHQRIPMGGKIQGIEPDWNACVQYIERSLGQPEHVVFSPNGHLFAVALEKEATDEPWEDEQRVELRSTITGTSMHIHETSGDPIRALVFSTDGNLLAIAHSHGNIRILTVKTGQVELICTSQGGGIEAIGFLPGSHLVVSLSNDGRIWCWERLGGTYQEKYCSFDALGKALNLVGNIHGATFSPCVKFLAFRQSWVKIKVYDVKTGEKLLMLHCDPYPTCFAFSADSRFLAVAYDHKLAIWDLAEGSEKLLITSPEKSRVVAFSPNGRFLASGTYSKTRLWDLETGACNAIFTNCFGMIQMIDTLALAFSPDSQLLANPQQLWDVTLELQEDRSDRHRARIATLAWSPCGQLLASASDDKTIQIWDAVTGIRRRVLEGHTSSVDDLLFSPDGDCLASASSDGTLRIWNMSSGALQKTIVGEWGSICRVAYSADGHMAASQSSLPGHKIKIWKVETGRHLRTFRIPKKFIYRDRRMNDVRLLTLSPNGCLMAVSTYTASLLCWDTATGKALMQNTSIGPVSNIVFSPDSQLIAVHSGFDISLWRVTEASCLHTLHPGGRLLVFSSDSRLLISAEENVNVWDTATGVVRYTFKSSQMSRPDALAISPDDRMIAVASRHSSVEVWDIGSNSKQCLTLAQEENITSLVFSSDSTILAATMPGSGIWLRHISSGSRISTISCSGKCVQNVDFVSHEIVVTVSDYVSPQFFNVWDDMAPRLHTYRIPRTCTDESLDEGLDTRLSVIGDWITQGSEKILWMKSREELADLAESQVV